MENIGYVGNIRSSIVKNVIGINLNKKQKNAIKNNFEKLKNKYDGKILINEVYKQTFNIDLKFDVFDVTKLIINSNLASVGLSSLYLNISNEFYNFILNKFLSSLSKKNYTFIKLIDNNSVVFLFGSLIVTFSLLIFWRYSCLCYYFIL